VETDIPRVPFQETADHVNVIGLGIQVALRLLPPVQDRLLLRARVVLKFQDFPLNSARSFSFESRAVLIIDLGHRLLLA
jgi:hypothetical protein